MIKMQHRSIVILDGTRDYDCFNASLKVLLSILTEDNNNEVTIFQLRDININHCIGCFSCWLKTPGKCIYIDHGSKIIQTVLTCHTLILFTPVAFGGFSSELKKILDRFLPIILPFFTYIDGETHHLSRYCKIPRFVGIGITTDQQKKYSQCFKILVGRNAINYHAPGYAADVISGSATDAELQHQFKKLLSNTDKYPGRDDLHNLTPPPAVPDNLKRKRSVLLLMGSPKITSRSTSAVIGEYLLKKIGRHGYSTSSICIGEDLMQELGQKALCSEVDRAGIIIIVSPLYVDSLPFLTTKALETIFRYKKEIPDLNTKRVFAVVNSGFPEAYQNSIALTICCHFTMECGMNWAGGLALGGAEALDLCKLPKYFSKISYSFLHHIVWSLNKAAKALAEGVAVPQEAIQLIAMTPFPFISFRIWRYFFVKKGTMLWKKKLQKITLALK
ncbi:MAG: flavodoxin family protein [Candidatus Electrothrix sp. AUS1_2]|nr:flavodoxin family protein [Candidatus Electrothrix sp. AUS1_2]